MKKTIETSIEINSSAAKVWKILTDFDSYPDWNPFITAISGSSGKGNQIKATIQGMKFSPVITENKENKQLQWLGKLWIKGLFDGHHKFSLTPIDANTVIFNQSEDFSGVLVKLFSSQLNEKTLLGFKEMNLTLKQRAEN